MPSPTETGRIIARIKSDTGLTWRQLADNIGSSPEYLRKVASGAKPGNNLRDNVAEFYRAGSVTKPVDRRRDRQGNIAKVRAAAEPGSGKGASRRPGENRVRATGKELYRLPSGRLGWTQYVEPLDPPGPLLQSLTSAGRGQKRVRFRVRYRHPSGDRRWAELGTKGGYTPRTAAQGIRAERSAEDWLAGQLSMQTYVPTGELEGVEVIAY